jgi:hypothetical protein
MDLRFRRRKSNKPMKQKDYNNKQITDYLLHKLPGEEETEIEERYFADPEFLRQLRSIERELIDRYVRDELTGEEKRSFERKYLSSACRRERVEFARALAELTSRAPAVTTGEFTGQKATPWWQSLPALLRGDNRAVALAAMVFVIVFGLWAAFVLVDRSNQGQEVVRQEDATPEPDGHQPGTTAQPANGGQTQPGKESDKTPRSKAPPRVATFTLSPYLDRDDAEAKEIIIPSGIKTIRLRLYHEGGQHGTYEAVLMTPEGEQVWKDNAARGKASEPGVLVLSLPARLLTSRDYVLRLSATTRGGSEDVGKYYFRVLRQ